MVYGTALCLWHLGRCTSLSDAASAARQALTSGKAMAHFRGE
jgi:anthranilate phosphoribosyltransferase